MTPPEINTPPKPARAVIRRDGRIYFSRQAERRLFFILTLIMLLLGILCQLGVF
ncbi:MAG: hypothetical protein WAK57_18655 [Desulfobacterales bacterium]|jgi:hypothetical protein